MCPKGGRASARNRSKGRFQLCSINIDFGLNEDIVEDWLREMIMENRGELLYGAFSCPSFQSHIRDYVIGPLELKREYFKEYGYFEDFEDCIEFDDDSDDFDYDDFEVG